MKRQALLVLAVGLLIAADAPKDDATKKERERLQGTWKIVSVQRAGKEEEKPVNTVATVVGNKFTTKADGKTIRAGTLKLDPSQQPKAVDATYTDGPDKGKTFQGIYTLEGDTWKICYSGPDQERPKAFPKKPGEAYLFLVLKRVME